jgi:hypothetical protein
MSDLAMARSFLEHALDHAKGADRDIDQAWTELSMTEVEAVGLFGIRSVTQGLIQRIGKIIDGVDRLQRDAGRLQAEGDKS